MKGAHKAPRKCRHSSFSKPLSNFKQLSFCVILVASFSPLPLFCCVVQIFHSDTFLPRTTAFRLLSISRVVVFITYLFLKGTPAIAAHTHPRTKKKNKFQEKYTYKRAMFSVYISPGCQRLPLSNRPVANE